MSYIGRGTDKISNVEKLDNISFSGSTATFNLTKGGTAFIPSSAECIRLAIDGIEQGNNYTVSGSQITFDFTPSGSSTNNWIYHIGVGVITTPGDGTVTLDKLSATGTKNGTTFLAGDNTFKTVSGTTINNNADNRVITGSGSANTLEGEANLTYNGTILGVGGTGDLGTGVHVKTSDTGGSVSANSDNLVLEENGNVGLTMLSANNGTGHIFFGNGGDEDEGYITYDSDNNRMRFGVNADERARIEGDGDFLINRTSNNGSYPGKLSVLETTDNISILAENTKTSSLGTSVLKVKTSQNTTNSSYNLMDGHAPSGRFLVRDSGNVQNTNNSYGSISDERVKQDITDANSQWEDIKALKVKNFKLKSDTSKTQIGVIAQELEASGMIGLVEDAQPEKEDVALHSDFGTIDSDGNFTPGQKVKSVKYSVLYMKSIKALQETMARIETLEAKVQALEENNGSN